MMRVTQVDAGKMLHLPAEVSRSAPVAVLLNLLYTVPHAQALLEPHLLQEEVNSAVAYQNAQKECRPGVHSFHGNLFSRLQSLKGCKEIELMV